VTTPTTLAQVNPPDPSAANAMVQTVVPAVVVSVSVAVAGVIVLVVLLKRREKRNKKAKALSVKLTLQRTNSRKLARNTSKYGIERNMINSNLDKNWEPPADYEYASEIAKIT
jgi:ABC-type xylose transport system permease subunit